MEKVRVFGVFDGASFNGDIGYIVMKYELVCSVVFPDRNDLGNVYDYLDEDDANEVLDTIRDFSENIEIAWELPKFMCLPYEQREVSLYEEVSS